MKLVKGSLRVEGDPKTKLMVYGGALAMVLGILGLGYLLLSLFQSGPVEVGTVTVVSAGKEVTPLQNKIYVTQDGVVTEKRRLVPGEIGDSAPTVEVDHIVVRFEGRSQNGPFYFTIYDEDGLTYSEKKAEFRTPTEPGTYLVCEETYWGVEKNNIGMEYYFWIVVGEEDLVSG